MHLYDDQATLAPVAKRFGSVAVTTCFYDSGLSRWGIEPPSPAFEANAPPISDSNDKHIYIEWNNYIFRIATKSQYCTTMNSLNFATATT